MMSRCDACSAAWEECVGHLLCPVAVLCRGLETLVPWLCRSPSLAAYYPTLPNCPLGEYVLILWYMLCPAKSLPPITACHSVPAHPQHHSQPTFLYLMTTITVHKLFVYSYLSHYPFILSPQASTFNFIHISLWLTHLSNWDSPSVVGYIYYSMQTVPITHQ